VNESPAWDGALGTAGGPQFGSALQAFARDREVAPERLAQACGLDPAGLEEVLHGKRRVGVSALASLAWALRAKPVEFLQRTGILSLDVYAAGLDPLFFLPNGPIRHDARIYMREINPRHQVPEADMTRRNPAVKAIAEDSLLDSRGKLEIELAYLLRLAFQETSA
jgi:hypothetical protein